LAIVVEHLVVVIFRQAEINPEPVTQPQQQL